MPVTGDMTDRTGAIFNQTPQDYDAVRPSYPTELIEDVIALSAIPERASILEIGCGTGQATILFARRGAADTGGYAMLCLDIGKDLAAIAAHKCDPYPNVTIQIASFEDWQPKGQTFDLAISATAFHWIPAQTGYTKIAQILKPRGSMALFWNRHPTPFTGFAVRVQQVYQRVVPEWGDPGKRPSTNEWIRARETSINKSGLFEPVLVKQYPWAKAYSTESYLRLLNTYSDHLALDERKRQKLFEGIGELIEREYGGIITRPYLSVLYIAQKID